MEDDDELAINPGDILSNLNPYGFEDGASKR